MNLNFFKKFLNNKSKSDRNLLILDNKYETNILKLGILNKMKNWMPSFLPVYVIYYGKAYNPPFFNNIIALRKLSLEDVQEIWNMTMNGGYICINNFYKSNFINSIVSEDLKSGMILIQKNIMKTYYFKEYRVLDFIIAGTMKGGTTAAITNLSMHPDISMVKEEIHYFDKMDVYQKGIGWYKSHFDYNKKRVGDKAPDVMYMPSCLFLLQMVNPHVKIILFLRNPIERAYSHWKMLRDSFNVKLSFEYLVNNELQFRMEENRFYYEAFHNQLIQRGFYYEKIMEILKYFSKDNLLIIISEKVRDNMNVEYQNIFRFLEIGDFHSKNFKEEFVSKSGDYLDKNSSLYKKLKKIYEPSKKNLEKFLGYKTDWW